MTITISGITTSNSINDLDTVNPFATVTISDSVSGELDGATISFTAGSGTLTGAGLSAGSVANGTIYYSLTAATPSDLQSQLQALTFTPASGQGAAGSQSTTSFALTVSVLKPTAPTLVATLSSGLLGPEGMVADAAGDIYVANYDKDDVLEFNASGALVRTLMTGEYPSSVALDNAGDLFVSNQTSNTVQEFDASGSLIRTLSSGLFNPRTVATDGAGDVFVANYYGANAVEEFDATGALVRTLSYNLASPFNLTTDAAGDLVVPDALGNLVQVFDPSGAAKLTLTNGVSYPTAVATDANGDIFVANGGNNTVEEFSATGDLIKTLSDGVYDPTGLVVDAAGDVIVENDGSASLEEFDASGAEIAVTYGLSFPQGVTQDAFGNVYVSNAGNSTVLKYSFAQYTAATDQTGSVTVTHVAAPTISGTLAGQTTSSETPIAPFSEVTVTDGNPGATDTLTITVGGAGGTLADGASFAGAETLSRLGSTYTLTGSAAALTAELDALSFTPTAGASNTTSTSIFTLSNKSSAFPTAATDSTTTVVDADPLLVTNAFELADDAIATTSTSIQLTANQQSESGSAMSQVAIDMTKNFTLSFQLYLGASSGADGIAFLLQDSPSGANATGSTGNGLGAAGITNSIGIRWDTYQNGDDPATPYTAFFNPAAANSVNNGVIDNSQAVYLGDVTNGAWQNITLTYTASTQTLSYSFNGVNEGSLSHICDTYIGGTSAYFGFTAGTGYYSNQQQVRNILLNGNAPPMLNLNASASSGATLDNYSTTFLEKGAAVPIAASDIKISDINSTTVQSATILLTNAQAGDSLNIGSLPSSINSVTDTSVAGQITVTLTGAASASDYQSAIDSIAFSNPDTGLSAIPRTINLSINDGAQSSNTAVTTINIVESPTISGTHATATAFEAPIAPFTGVTIGDTNSGATDTLTITVGGVGGTLADGASFAGAETLSRENYSTYTLTGSASAITAELDALSFTPLAGAPDSTAASSLELSVASSAAPNAPVIDDQTIVQDSDVPQLSLSGFTELAQISDQQTIDPFANLTVTDTGADDVINATISFAAANGTLSGSGLRQAFVTNGTAYYTINAMTQNALQTELRGLIFTPTLQQAAAGTKVTTTFSLTLNDVSAVPVITLPYDIGKPSAVVTDGSGDVFVADTLDNTVFEFNSSNHLVRSISGGISSPVALATDSAGDLFVANTGGDDVTEYDASGALVRTLSNATGGAVAVATDDAGDVYVLSAGSNAVAEFDATGAHIRDMSGGNLPRFLTTDAAGDMFVASQTGNSVMEYDNSGALVRTLTNSLNQPDALATDKFGDLFVANYGNNKIEEFNAYGERILQLTNLNQPTALTTDAAGDLFVANSGSNQVLEFSPSGTLMAALSYGVQKPNSLTLDSSGNLYVSNSGSNTVEEFKLPGLSTIGSSASSVVVTQSSPPLLSASTTVTGQTDFAERPLSPFAAVTLTDPSGAANAQNTLTISLAMGGGGVLTLTGAENGVVFQAGLNEYTLTGTATAISNALSQLVFTPLNTNPNSTALTQFSLSDLDPAIETASNNLLVSVADTAAAVAPTLSASASLTGQTTASAAPINPFASVSVNDANDNGADTDTLTITLSGASLGTLALSGTPAGVMLAGSGSSYTLTGTAAAITSALPALAYTATNTVANSAAVTNFTLSDVSSAGPSASNALSASVAVNGPPCVTSIVRTGVNPNNAASDSFAITFSQAVTGLLASDFTVASTDTVSYSDVTLTGSGAAYTVTVDGVTGAGELGVNFEAGLTSVLDADGLSATSGFQGQSYSVTGAAPLISGTRAGQKTLGRKPITPFSGVTITDPNVGGVETLTITLSGGEGALTGTGLTGSGATYTLIGSAATTTSELDALEFTPASGSAGASTTVTFTLSDKSNDFASPTVDDTTSVTVLKTTADDFNGDGGSDILWRYTNGDTNIWLSSGSGGFAGQDYGPVAIDRQVAAVGDFNGDGLADILWRSSANGDTSLWLSNGSGGFTPRDLGVVGNDWSIAGSGDFNGDGEADILWRNVNGDANLWLSNGSGGFTARDLGVVRNDWSIAGVGDFNGDGQADILWRNANGDSDLWLSNGAGGFTARDLGVVGNDWTIGGLGDFNGDGQSDILWRNANGDANLWLSNGSGGFNVKDLGVVGSDWAIAGVGDYNRDGQADILWRNANGDANVWLSNGASGFAGQDLGQVATNWRIVGT